MKKSYPNRTFVIWLIMVRITEPMNRHQMRLAQIPADEILHPYRTFTHSLPNSGWHSCPASRCEAPCAGYPEEVDGDLLSALLLINPRVTTDGRRCRPMC